MNSKRLELLSPGGSIESIKAAVIAGADAIYCGLDRFNARNRATNIDFDSLKQAINFAHQYNCKIFLTLNIIIVENEIPPFVELLNKLGTTKIDAVILQDWGMFYLVKKYFPHLEIHASTQTTTHNEGQISFQKKLNADRVNLCRELNLNEIRDLSKFADKVDMGTEVFVHGSQCIAYSGMCYMSTVIGGSSANRGCCSQPCRDSYAPNKVGSSHPLNIMDNSAYLDLGDLKKAGVHSLKVEGRIKKYDYVHQVTKTLRKQLDAIESNAEISSDMTPLNEVFNRGFSNGFLKDKIGKSMFAESPRDYGFNQLRDENPHANDDEFALLSQGLVDTKTKITQDVGDEINRIDISLPKVKIFIKGSLNCLLTIKVKTPNLSFTIESKSKLADKGNNPPKQCLNRETLHSRLKKINDLNYKLDDIDTSELAENLIFSFAELRSIRDEILLKLNDNLAIPAKVELPPIEDHSPNDKKTKLSISISRLDQIPAILDSKIQVFFELPDDMNFDPQIFIENPNLIPSFPAIILSKFYSKAVEFLNTYKPDLILTNNSGIAYEACKQGIPWIAGIYFNVSNSYSLICLQEEFNAVGAFVTMEMNQRQLNYLKRPEGFDIYYTVYSPLMLMESRQCFFLNSEGCYKSEMDSTCLATCERTGEMENEKGMKFRIDKTKGNINQLFNKKAYLNTKLLSDPLANKNHLHFDISQLRSKNGFSKEVVANSYSMLCKFQNNSATSIETLQNHFGDTVCDVFDKGL